MKFMDDSERTSKLDNKFMRHHLWWILKQLDGDKLIEGGYNSVGKPELIEAIIKHVRDYKWKLGSLDYAIIFYAKPRENKKPQAFVRAIQQGMNFEG